MKRLAVLHSVVACLLIAGVCFGEDRIIGFWGDKDESNIYVFRKNGEFEYHRRKAATAGDNASTTAGREEQTAYERISGVWTGGKQICSTGLQKGDLMIYVEEMQCCLMTQVVAGKVVLSAVFTKGTDAMSICRNRVLSRMEALPGKGER